MSELITLRNNGDVGTLEHFGDAEIIAEGIDTEAPKSFSVRNMTANQLRQYAACIGKGFADRSIKLANDLKTQYDSMASKDAAHLKIMLDTDKNGRYKAKLSCALPIAKQAVCREIGRNMNSALSNTDMYSSGLKRSIIEDSYTTLVDEAAPLVALAYRDEISLDDKTYLEARANLIASLDKSNMYVATRALNAVAETQVDLALYAADQRNQTTLNNIDSVSRIVANIEALAKNEAVRDLFRPKSESGSGQRPSSNQFGGGAPVRPDNPGGYNPSAGVTGSNVNVGGGAASIPTNVPTYTTGR